MHILGNYKNLSVVDKASAFKAGIPKKNNPRFGVGFKRLNLGFELLN